MSNLLGVSSDFLLGKETMKSENSLSKDDLIQIEEDRKKKQDLEIREKGRKLGLASFIVALSCIIASIIPIVGTITPICGLVLGLRARKNKEDKLSPYSIGISITYIVASVIYLIIFYETGSLMPII